jgi:hypothetical protein
LVPDKPAERFARKQVKAQFAVIDAQVYQKRGKSRQNHVDQVLKKNGALLRAKHCAPDAEDIISRAKQYTQRKKDKEAECLG